MSDKPRRSGRARKVNPRLSEEPAPAAVPKRKLTINLQCKCDAQLLTCDECAMYTLGYRSQEGQEDSGGE